MKLSPHAFTRLWDLHAWVGVIASLVLYVMFLAGSITLFRDQLETWGEPLAQHSAVRPTTLQSSLERGLAAAGATEGDLWFYPPRRGRGAAKLAYQKAGATEQNTVWIEPDRSALVPERERLASFLYSLHFLWHDAIGTWLYYWAGLLAVALLLTLVTGVLVHLKDLVRQFHQFRPSKSRRVLWSDMHKVLGVMGLPFQLVYAYTGAFIVLGPLLLQTFVGPVFRGDAKRAQAAAWGSSDATDSQPGPRATVLTADELVSRARLLVPGISVESIKLRHHGRENGVVEVRGMTAGSPKESVTVRLRQIDGAALRVQSPQTEGASGAVRHWIYGLHFAYFGGLPLRFLFFLLGLGTCATILTGNWVWLARREARRNTAGNRTLARLTVGVGAGSFVATGALFLASRLFPLDWASRGTAEELTFVAALALCIGWALHARSEGSAWRQQLGLAGALFLPVPALAGRWSSAGVFGGGPPIASVVGVDVAVLTAALSLCVGVAALRWASFRTAEAAAPASDRVESSPSRDVVLGHAGSHDA